MNYGYRICYHKDIPFSPPLENFLFKKIQEFSSEASYKRRLASSAFYRRGILGYCLDKDFSTRGDLVYTFRRLTKHRRVFGVVPIEDLELREPLVLDQCMCAMHRGGQLCKLKEPYSEDQFITFFETGKIKG